MLRRDEPFSQFLGPACSMPHDRINRLAENTLQLEIIDSNSNYERACFELYRVAVLYSKHISIL